MKTFAIKFDNLLCFSNSWWTLQQIWELHNQREILFRLYPTMGKSPREIMIHKMDADGSLNMSAVINMTLNESLQGNGSASSELVDVPSDPQPEFTVSVMVWLLLTMLLLYGTQVACRLLLLVPWVRQLLCNYSTLCALLLVCLLGAILSPLLLLFQDVLAHQGYPSTVMCIVTDVTRCWLACSAALLTLLLIVQPPMSPWCDVSCLDSELCGFLALLGPAPVTIYIATIAHDHEQALCSGLITHWKPGSLWNTNHLILTTLVSCVALAVLLLLPIMVVLCHRRIRHSHSGPTPLSTVTSINNKGNAGRSRGHTTSMISKTSSAQTEMTCASSRSHLNYVSQPSEESCWTPVEKFTMPEFHEDTSKDSSSIHIHNSTGTNQNNNLDLLDDAESSISADHWLDEQERIPSNNASFSTTETEMNSTIHSITKPPEVRVQPLNVKLPSQPDGELEVEDLMEEIPSQANVLSQSPRCIVQADINSHQSNMRTLDTNEFSTPNTANKPASPDSGIPAGDLDATEDFSLQNENEPQTALESSLSSPQYMLHLVVLNQPQTETNLNTSISSGLLVPARLSQPALPRRGTSQPSMPSIPENLPLGNIQPLHLRTMPSVCSIANQANPFSPVQYFHHHVTTLVFMLILTQLPIVLFDALAAEMTLSLLVNLRPFLLMLNALYFTIVLQIFVYKCKSTTGFYQDVLHPVSDLVNW